MLLLLPYNAVSLGLAVETVQFDSSLAFKLIKSSVAIHVFNLIKQTSLCFGLH